MREATVEQHLIDRVEETGGITRKMQWIGRNGAPDRFCGWPRLGRFAMPELKRPLTPKAEDHQKREHARLRACGIRVDVLASKEDVDRFIEEMTS
jgi:hypothetical protein